MIHVYLLNAVLQQVNNSVMTITGLVKNHFRLAAYHLTGNMQMLHQHTKKVKNTTQQITDQSLSLVSVVKLWNMSLQNTYLTIWKASLLYDLQHGFRHSRSCETQLLSFVQELAANSDKNIQTDLIIMDFAKAFDKVPHQQLLYKLKFYGIKNQTLNWISAFLSNCTQTVILDGESSDIAPVTSGVPQGTVLDPVLFLVYINDLSEYMKSSQLRLFADDSIIYKTIKSQKDCDSLQEDLDAAAR